VAALAHAPTVVTLPAPAAQNFGEGLRRPCRWQALGGMLGAVVRLAPARPATTPGGSTTKFSRDRRT